MIFFTINRGGWLCVGPKDCFELVLSTNLTLPFPHRDADDGLSSSHRKLLFQYIYPNTAFVDSLIGNFSPIFWSVIEKTTEVEVVLILDSATNPG